MRLGLLRACTRPSRSAAYLTACRADAADRVLFDLPARGAATFGCDQSMSDTAARAEQADRALTGAGESPDHARVGQSMCMPKFTGLWE